MRALALAFALALLLFTSATAATFIVTSTGDASGSCTTACTLRQAITSANNTAGTDTIEFNIPGAGPHRIAVSFALPAVTQPVLIDGYSQPGASANTLPTGSNAVIRIVLDVSVLSSGDGLGLFGSASARGLSIVGNPAASVNGVALGDDSTLTGSWVGIEPDGTLRGHRNGVSLVGNGAVLGGPAFADRNVIGASANAAVIVPITRTHRIENNLIGLKADGTTPAQNVFGIHSGVAAAASEVVRGNTISCSSNVNILGYGTLVEDNRLGTTADGVGNPGCMTAHEVPRPHAVWRDNTVAFRPVRGVLLAQDAITGVVLQGNRIHSAGHPIDLAQDGFTPNDPLDIDGGPNQRQNHPLITSAERVSSSQLRLSGSLHSLPNTAFRLQFFGASGVSRSSGTTALADAERVSTQIIDVTTDSSGDAVFGPTLISFSGTGTLGAVSATATRMGAGFTLIETSELGAAQVVHTPGVSTFDVTNTQTLGPGSLHNAFLLAEATPDGAGAERIRFAIPGAGPHTLTASGITQLTSHSRIEIDGYTQAGSVMNGSVEAFNASLRIDLLNYRLHLTHPQSLVRGLLLRGNSPLLTTHGAIEGCALGVNASGTGLNLATQGAALMVCAGCRIGGPDATQRNQLGCPIAGQSVPDTQCVEATGEALIENNLIGLQRSGNAALVVPGDPGTLGGTSGIRVVSGSARIRGNRIGFLHRGIVSSGEPDIEANRLGIAVNGGAAGNFFAGIELLGGRARVLGNHIRHQGRAGILIGNGSTGNALIDNRLSSNARLGVDLNLGGVTHGDGVNANDVGDGDGGANGGQNHPVLSGAVRTQSSVRAAVTLASVPSTAFDLRYCLVVTPDASGHGECDEPVGSAQRISTDASGLYSGDSPELPYVAGMQGVVVSAARVLPDGEETSEFSAVAPIAERTTTHIITLAPANPAFGQPIDVSVRVESQGGVVPGAVTVSASSGGSCVAPITAGQGQCTLTPAAAGAQTLSASYPASTAFTASSDSLPLDVQRAATTLTIQSDTPDPSTFGDAITVVVQVASSTGVPVDGPVVVGDGTAQCKAVLGSGGEGACILVPGSSGLLSLSAHFSGTPDLEPSSDTEAHRVNAVASDLTLLSHLPNPSVSGQPVTVTAQLSSAVGTPAGPILISDGAGATCQIDGAQGSCPLIPINAGDLTLRADFSGTSAHLPSTASAVQRVDRASTLLNSGPPTDPDGSTPRQFALLRFPVQLEVVSPGSGAPTGSITVSGTPGVEVCVLILPASTCALVVQSPGLRTFQLHYSGDARFLPSQAEVSVEVLPDQLFKAAFEKDA